MRVDRDEPLPNTSPIGASQDSAQPPSTAFAALSHNNNAPTPNGGESGSPNQPGIFTPGQGNNSSGSESNPTAAPKRHIACSLCRRRKLRCDGAKPTCATCKRLGQLCEYTDIGRRAGPRRGYIRQLEFKVAEYERLLGKKPSQDQQQNHPYGSPLDEAGGEEDAGKSSIANGKGDELPPQEVVDRLSNTYFSTFNRILPVVSPQSMEDAPLVLKYAIMATAAAGTPRYRSVLPVLYQRARRWSEQAPTDSIDGGSTTAQTAAYIQALCLLAHIETREGMLPQAWITVGKAYRAATMMSLHMLDDNGSQEKRRAFLFLVFCDCMGSLATSLPSVFQGMASWYGVWCKLPMNDKAFLEGRGEPLLTLDDLMGTPALFTQFPHARFAFVIVLSVCALQISELGQFPNRRYIGAGASHRWIMEFQRLDKTLNELVRLLPQILPPSKLADGSGLETDKEAIALHLLAHCGTLVLCRSGLHAIQNLPELLEVVDPANLLHRAMISMMEVVFLTRNPHDIATINIHPLHPIMLFVVGLLISYFLQYRLVQFENFQLPIEYIMRTLEELTPLMPLTGGLVGFLHKAVPPDYRQQGSTMGVAEVLASRGVDLSLPNLFQGDMRFQSSNHRDSHPQRPLNVPQSTGTPGLTPPQPPGLSPSSPLVQQQHTREVKTERDDSPPPFLGINMRPFNPIEEVTQLDSLSPLAALQFEISQDIQPSPLIPGMSPHDTISQDASIPTPDHRYFEHVNPVQTDMGLSNPEESLHANPEVEDPPIVLLEELPTWNRTWR